MPRSKTPTVSLEEAKARFEDWRQNRKGKAAIPDELWAAAVEVARKEGVSRTVDRTARGVEPSEASDGRGFRSIDETRPAGIRGTGRAAATAASRMHHRTGRSPRQTANPAEECLGFVSGDAEPRVIGVGVLIQITPQLRILVAIEAIDGRKGIDSLAQLCREKLDADPFSGCLFIFRSRSGKAIRILAYDGQGFWIATKRLSKGRFKWWPTGNEPAKTLRAHQAQLLLAAGNPDTEAAPVWRRVSA